MYLDELATRITLAKAKKLGHNPYQAGDTSPYVNYWWWEIDGQDMEKFLAEKHDFTQRDAFYEAAKKNPNVEPCPKVAWSGKQAEEFEAEWKQWAKRRGYDLKADPLLVNPFMEAEDE